MNWADTAEPSGNLAAAADTGLDSEFDSELDSEPELELDLDLDLDPDLGLHWCFAQNCQAVHLVDLQPKPLNH
ncbi:MAG: hypothetical protein WC028_01545 [Candidatus Obscuribacterales bacterium]